MKYGMYMYLFCFSFYCVYLFKETFMMIFTQNEKNKSTDDRVNEKPYFVCYRPLIVSLFLTFKKVGQRPTI